MKSKSLKIAVLAVVVGMCVILVYKQTQGFKQTSPGQAAAVENQIDPEFANYISSFTSGYISSGSSIKIKFSREITSSVQLNEPLKEEYFSFDPEIKGVAQWKDAQTMEFTPSERLKAGTVYKATFHLGNLVKVKKELRDFDFQFQTIEQSIQMVAGDLKCYHSGDFSFYSLAGTISSADYADNETVEKTLNARLNTAALKARWVHDEAATTHRFIIDSIQRDEKENRLTVTCDAKDLGITYSSERGYVVAPKNEFRLLNVKVITESDPHILINFSNPVDQSQSLEGLISIDGLSEIKYIVNINQVQVYPANAKTGSFKMRVNEGIKDARGQRLPKSSEHSIVFSQVNPEIRFTGSGHILPSTNGLNLAFETVNLKAVDVKVVKIYENNILQFLQTNDMSGSNQISQVGKKVAEKRINLGITNPADFGVWKKFSLDLSSLIKAEPGAIYRVTLGMRKSYSTYPCLGNTDNDRFEMAEVKDAEEEEPNYFGYYDEDNMRHYDYEEEEDYNWEDRDNPCKAYYYRRYDRTVSRNILASDIGLTLKKGNDGSLLVVTNDLLTTKPIARADIQLYDYQKQLIAEEQTDNDGFVKFSPAHRPYFLVAKKDKQCAYLRIEDGAALSLSMFDVSGEAIKKGIKGFIYGERGVWRPGDTLFLNFILEDKLGKLPPGHPVSFALFNPQGQVYKRLLSTNSVHGFYSFTTATDKNAPTGLWTAEVKVGTLKFNKSIRIETIMPNRLKIELQMPSESLLIGTAENSIELRTSWLTGAKAKNLAAKINVALTAMKTEFPKYRQYEFDERAGTFEPQNINLFDGKVNDEGSATVPIDFNLENHAPGFLKASFNTTVFEPGGAFSVDRFSTAYSPYSHYVGIKLPEGEKNSGILYTGRDHYLDIATVDAKGQGASRSQLKFEMYKLEWRWWWDQYNDELANYANSQYHAPVKVETISSKNGTARVKVNIRENQWGRYLIRVTDETSGHSSSVITYFDWANWMERDGGADNKVMSNILSFTTDKNTYKTNEEVTITLPSPKNGRALITVENGSRVLEAHWLETGQSNATFKFKVKAEMAPNVYVHVSMMQPHARTNDLPIRLYGAVPISIDDPETHITPEINMPRILEPEKNASITVSEQNGKEMAFTIAVVEEGLLDITRFKTPDPFKAFYAKEALGVKTWDVYDHVIGAYGAELERILSIGGDGSEVSNDGAKANRFKPVIKFFGPFKLGKGEKKTVNFMMPMYVGAVRTMVIAGNNGAYGFAEKSTKVKAPLMILGTLPRVLSVTEEVKLPVSVFGGDKNIGKTEIKVQLNGLLQPRGDLVKSINVNKDEEELVTFDLAVKNITGIAKVRILASGGGHTASYDMELDVRNPNPYQTTVTDFYVDAGKTAQKTFTAPGVLGTNSGVLEISSIPPINLEDRLGYLIRYPHGCIEQTTSQAFAQLHLNDLLSLDAERKTEIENNIRNGIRELAKFQLSSGGLSYWPGMSSESDWGTTYAGHFLLLAEKKGYTLPSSMKKSWLSYQQNKAQSFNLNDNRYWGGDQLQAYRLYSLALANAPVIGAMNRLREYGKLSNQAKWLLALSYAQIGQLQEAEKMISTATPDFDKYHVNYYTYGTSERDLAIVLQTYCLLDKKQQAFSQLKKVADYLSSSSWLSTQTTAFGLIAVSDFAKHFGGSSAMQARCSINGKESSVKGGQPVVQLPLPFKGTNSGTFKVQNDGDGVLFGRVIVKGKPPLGEEKEGNENITMQVTYKDLDGNVISPDELVQGTNFMVTVTVRNLGGVGVIENLALNNYIPSGWEIHNARLDDNEAVLKNSAFSYQDIRDDRVYTYFDLHTNESKTFNLLLNAAYEGRYYLPAVNVEAMYDNTVFARNKGKWISVVRTQSKVAGK